MAATARILCALLAVTLAGASNADEVAADRAAAQSVRVLTSTTVPPIGDHFVWVVDQIFAHAQLYDGDTGAIHGMVDAGTTISPKPPLYARGRGEIYVVEVAYSRGRRGERIDFVTIYDHRTLGVTGEVVLPTRQAESAASLGYAVLLDDERFLAVFNQFPLTSVSIVDLAARTFVGEIPAAGCAGIYPTGPRSYGMLCGNGGVAHFVLDDAGRLASTHESERFFDPVADPAMLAGSRVGTRWLYPTFEGQLHAVDFARPGPTVESWPLVSDAEREAGWRPGGRQLAAANAELGRLYVLFHQGGPGTHKDPGPEIWVYDVAARERVSKFAVPNLTAAFIVGQFGLGEEGFWPWLMHTMMPDDGGDTITVSRDAEPLVFVRHGERGAVAVLDGRTGEHLRTLTEVGLGGLRLEVP